MIFWGGFCMYDDLKVVIILWYRVGIKKKILFPKKKMDNGFQF